MVATRTSIADNKKESVVPKTYFRNVGRRITFELETSIKLPRLYPYETDTTR